MEVPSRQTALDMVTHTCNSAREVGRPPRVQCCLGYTEFYSSMCENLVSKSQKANHQTGIDKELNQLSKPRTRARHGGRLPA